MLPRQAKQYSEIYPYVPPSRVTRPSLKLAKLPLTCWYSFALDETQQTFHRTWYPTWTIIQNVTFSIALHAPQATFPTRHGSAIGNRTVRVERASPLVMQLPYHMKPICIESETLWHRTFDLTGGNQYDVVITLQKLQALPRFYVCRIVYSFENFLKT